MEDNVLVDTTIPLKNIPTESRTSITSKTQLSVDTMPQPIMTERRVHSTPLADNFPTLLATLTMVGFETPASHRWSTPIGQNLDQEFS